MVRRVGVRRYGTIARPVRSSGNLLQDPQPYGPVPWNYDGSGNVFWIGESQGDGPIGPHGPYPQYGATLPVVTRAISLLADPLTAGPFRVRERSAGNPAGTVVDSPRWLTDPQLARSDARTGAAMPIPASARVTRAKYYRTWIQQAICWGIGYMYFEESASGQPVAGTLQIIQSEFVDINDDGNWIIGDYEFDRDGRRNGHRLIALRNPHHDKGVFVAHPEVFQIGGRIQKYTGGIFRSGVPAGFLKVNNPNLSATQAQALKDSWMSAHGGDARSIAVLNATVDFHAVALSPVDAALAEVKRLNISDVGFAFNIAPETLGVTLGNSATYSNVSQWFEAHRDFSLSPWIAAVEDALSALLVADQSVEVNLDDMAAPPLGDRMSAWQTAISAGVLTVNEVRAREGLPPLPDRPQNAPVAPVDAPEALEGGGDA